GYGLVYSAAGPQILHMLLSGRVLDRLYLTYANRILGGERYATIVAGHLFEPAIDLSLHSLYHDPHGLDGLGQLFAAYSCAV
ncbi:MAG: RibD family protein, partial [Candidatus Promineifilaceae bacterium]